MKRFALAITLCCATMPAWVICVSGMVIGDPMQAVVGGAVTVLCLAALWSLP
jgi:maltodextrin utilization protein YvdJ